MSKKTKQKREKHDFLIWIILLIIIIFLIFLYQQRNEEINIDEIEPLKEINLSQYKLATFSDFFSSDAWIDVDKTTLIFDEKQKSFVFPKSEQDIAGSLSNDSQIKTGPRQVVSKKFNFNVKEIKACRIDKSENLEINSKIRYFLANNQEIEWIETEIGQVVYFENSGNDLRWRVVISPLERTAQEAENSSKISSINITYWYEK